MSIKVKTTIFPGQTVEIEVADGSTIETVMNTYQSLTGTAYTERHSCSVNGRAASPATTLVDGDRVIATQNKEGAMEEAEITEVEIETTEDKLASSFEVAKNLIKAQAGKYDKNPIRKALIEDAIKVLNETTPTEEELAESAKNIVPGTITRTVKWNNEALSFATAKSYTIAELTDRAEELKEGSLQKEAYLLLIKKLTKEWKLDAVLFPCFHPRCNSNEFIQVTENADGLWVAKCTNPAHKSFPVETQAFATKEEAESAWNTMVR